MAVRVVVTVGLFAALAGQAQQPPPTIRTRTTLVPVDVRVVDRDGRPITDLKKEDFTVLENGRRQDVRFFATHALTPQPAPPAGAQPGGLLPLRPAAGATDEPVMPDARVFLIALGRGRLQTPLKGVDATIGFVKERLLPQDRVAVMAWNRASDFTTDRAGLVTLLERFKKDHERIETDLREYFSGLRASYGNGEIPPEIQAKIDAVFGAAGATASHQLPPGTVTDAAGMADQRRRGIDALQQSAIAEARIAAPGGDFSTTFDTADAELRSMGMGLDEYAATTLKGGQEISALYSAIRYLRQFEGGKHIIFVNEAGIFLPRLEDDHSLAAFANDARVAIHTIRTGGVLTMNALVQRCPTCPTSVDINRLGRVAPGQIAANQTVRNIAEFSGGISGSASIDTLLAQIDGASRFEYVLGYAPEDAAWDGRYRRITVTVNRRDARVLYRHGYYAAETLTGATRRELLTYARVAAAGGITRPISELAITATAEHVKRSPEVVLTITVKIDRLKFADADGRRRGSIQITTFCGDDAESVVGQTWQTVDLNLSEETYQRMLVEGVTYTQRVPVRGEPKHAKVIAYDYASDRTGSVTVKIENR